KKENDMPSAVIAGYAYDPDQQTLEVHYHSGKVYHYLNVPEKVFRAMRSTMVKGICFFLQAEEGIRYIGVTGVQTCALPISMHPLAPSFQSRAIKAYQDGGFSDMV